MKGIVFTLLGKLVEEKWDLATWQELLDETQPASRGAYTSAASYPDQELFDLVGALSRRTGLTADALVRAFGKFTLPQLARLYPDFFTAKGMDAKKFLQSVDGFIHVEVRKLYPDAGLPTFQYEDPAPDRLVMVYRSERKLCRFAEGLIDGTADYFKTAIAHRQVQCVLQGNDYCRFDLAFGGKT